MLGRYVRRHHSSCGEHVACAVESLETRRLLAVSAVNSFTQANLVSDGAVAALFTDPNLVNPWGIVATPSGADWVAANGSGKALSYDPFGRTARTPVSLPAPTSAGTGATAAPTGAVLNNTNVFMISKGGVSSPARLIVATEDGTILGFKGAVDPANGVMAADNSAFGAVYKGLARGAVGNQQFLYAADFHNGRIDVYNSSFGHATLNGDFTDPNLPVGYAPFNVVNISGQLFVSYALQDTAKHDDVPGAGHGFIDIYNTDGTFVRRLVSQTGLNSPWAMTIAPAGFGRFGGDLLVGNFGSGFIKAYDPSSGALIATLKDTTGHAVNIDGLWALRFGNGAGGSSTTTLFFTAGLNGEQDGLFGSLTFSPPSAVVIPQASPILAFTPATPSPDLMLTPIDVLAGTGGSMLM